MQDYLIRLSLATCLALSLSATALGQDPIHEDFESYLLGPLDGQGHWVVNDMNATTVGATTGPNGNLTQVVEQTPNADTACAFADVTTTPIEDGKWQITISILVEADFDGESQLSIANQLGAPAPDDWYVHIRLNGAAGILFCDCGGSSVQVPLVVDEWSTIRVVVDISALDIADVPVAVYYRDALLASFYTVPLLNPRIDGIRLITGTSGGPTDKLSYDNLEVLPFDPTEPGMPRCFGAGAVTPCPCDNDVDPIEGSGCENSTTRGTTLFASGSASLSAGDLVLTVIGAVPFQPSVFIQGKETIGGGFGLPFGEGLRCCGGGVVRIETVFPDASGNASTGVNGAMTGAGPGDLRCYQFWYRDPWSVCGSGFNLSNGYEIFWQP